MQLEFPHRSKVITRVTLPLHAAEIVLSMMSVAELVVLEKLTVVSRRYWA